MLRGGVDLKLVSDRLGHASTEITASIYLHPDADMHREAAKKTRAAIHGA
jgi:integrase